ncbi:DinB family protein [Paenibacillus sp. N1-5-1-14]|uniref:DinB family protein n=1 Tax=Paenibacillus radicibacter TaxID=2972488 RepID=UPI002158DFA7|nr:DinB family protein [Paenibacillus radicibacter]MCR8641988.1 DinB family protein [Paenibacillus radicibacter]
MELQEINHKLKETRDDLLVLLARLNEEQLIKRKDSDSWSIAQIFQHLSKTEELYSIAIKRGLKTDEDSIMEHKSMDVLIDRSNKLEAPDMVIPVDETLDHNEIIARLRNSREKLHAILNAVEDPSILSRRSFVHPVFKEMLLIDWVESLYVHEQRHMKQINEILNECK